MSVVFYIKNKKKVFGYVHPMTVGELLDLVPGMEQFDHDEAQDGFDRETLYKSPLSVQECFHVGEYGKSGRGVEVAYNEENKEYSVRVMTPSIRADWELAFRIMKALSKKMGNPVVHEGGTVLTAENIDKFDFMYDINYGIESVLDFTRRDDPSGDQIIFGIIRPVCFNRKLADEVLNSEKRMARFEELLLSTQWLEAYPARQTFFKDKNTGDIFGHYTLNQELETILPFKPYIEFENIADIDPEDIESWRLTLVSYEDEIIMIHILH